MVGTYTCASRRQLADAMLTPPHRRLANESNLVKSFDPQSIAICPSTPRPVTTLLRASFQHTSIEPHKFIKIEIIPWRPPGLLHPGIVWSRSTPKCSRVDLVESPPPQPSFSSPHALGVNLRVMIVRLTVSHVLLPRKTKPWSHTPEFTHNFPDLSSCGSDVKGLHHHRDHAGEGRSLPFGWQERLLSMSA